MPISNPLNRLFTADLYFMAVYNGTLAITDLSSGSVLYDLLGIFRNVRINLEVQEDEGSATYDPGVTKLPYRQQWTAEIETATDLVYNSADSFFEIIKTNGLGIGPYWLVFQKGPHAYPLFQKGTIRNYNESANGDAQTQGISFSLQGIPADVTDF